jgi:hypothetical protein
VIGLWLPNVLFTAMGAWAFRQSAREQPLVAIDRIGEALARAGAWLRRRFRMERP